MGFSSKKKQSSNDLIFTRQFNTSSQNTYSSHIEKKELEESYQYELAHKKSTFGLKFSSKTPRTSQHWLIRNLNILNAPYSKIAAFQASSKFKKQELALAESLDNLYAELEQVNQLSQFEQLLGGDIIATDSGSNLSKIDALGNTKLTELATQVETELTQFNSALMSKLDADKNKHFRVRGLFLGIFVFLLAQQADQIDFSGDEGYQLAEFDGGKGYQCTVHTYRIFSEIDREGIIPGAQDFASILPLLNMWLPALSPLLTDEYVNIVDDHTATYCTNQDSSKKDFFTTDDWEHDYITGETYSEWDFDSIDNDFQNSLEYKKLVSDVRTLIEEEY